MILHFSIECHEIFQISYTISYTMLYTEYCISSYHMASGRSCSSLCSWKQWWWQGSSFKLEQRWWMRFGGPAVCTSEPHGTLSWFLETWQSGFARIFWMICWFLTRRMRSESQLIWMQFSSITYFVVLKVVCINIKWQCGLFNRRPNTLCYSFNIQVDCHRFRDQIHRYHTLYHVWRYRIQYPLRHRIRYDIQYDIQYGLLYSI